MQGGGKASEDEGGFSVQTAAVSAGAQALPFAPAPPLCAWAGAAGSGTGRRVPAPAAPDGRPAGLLDPAYRLGSMCFASSLSPVKVFPECVSTADKQSLEGCSKSGNLLFLPMPLRYSSPSPL